VVPTVPLVYQQTDTIQRFTGLEVKSFCGEMNVDFWDRKKWIEELDLENTHVIVLTPQILLNTLSHAYLDISVFDLLVIDECHHARKGNAVAVALRTFYHTLAQGKHRPKVLGLTASPIWTPDNPEKSLHELQMTLASTIVAVKTNISELDLHAPRPKEHIVFYQPNIIPQNTELYGALDALPLDWTLGKLAWSKIKLRASVALVGLGPMGMDLYLVKQLQGPVREIVREVKLGFPVPVDVDWKIAKELFGILDPLDVDIGSSISLDLLSPKFQKLVETITKYHRAGIAEEEEDSQFQAIIFATQRHIAFGLAELLGKIDELSGWIKVRTLVGHGTNDYVAGGQAFNEQKRLVQDFRDGKFNVLISTR
jgi:endoribonuclease Dicer